jgi:hypothetical protein
MRVVAGDHFRHFAADGVPLIDLAPSACRADRYSAID